MKTFEVRKWLLISLLNFLIVALYGVVMRYKIGFEFPFLEQKNLQHAHSHFAFIAWVSQMLMVYMTEILRPAVDAKRLQTYHQVLLFNLFCSFGMLLSFTVQGYAFFSISFSTLSIGIAFYFNVMYWRDLAKAHYIAQKNWFKLALLFNFLSSLGTFYLVYMMASKNIAQHNYLISIYWYLHFQYNGWFFFACGGLFVHYLQNMRQYHIPERIFIIFAASCFPAFGLSILWLDLPFAVYLLIVVAGLAQVYAFSEWIIILMRQKFWQDEKISTTAKYLIIFVGSALCIKLALQAASVIPALSKLAFGFRPVVIAYMHLIFLAIISVFLLFYGYLSGFWQENKLSKIGICVFAVSVFLNEAALAVQGISAFAYILIPAINEILFGISLGLFSGILLFLLSQKNIRKFEVL
jgi:hypothetical protein